MEGLNLFSLEKKYSFTGEELPRSTTKLPPEEAEYYEKQKEIRRTIGLPITKSLVYHKHPYEKGNKPYDVISFEAKKFINDKGERFDWFDVTLQVMGIEKDIRIHGDYFAEMQKPNFVEQINEVIEEE